MFLRALLLLSLLMAMTGCDDSGTPIRVVLPNGYIGKFTVVKDSVHGVPLFLCEGTYEFVVPTGGVLAITDTHPFFRIAALTIQYHNGEVLLAPNVPSSSVQLIGVNAGFGQGSSSKTEGSTELDGTTISWTVKPPRAP